MSLRRDTVVSRSPAKDVIARSRNFLNRLSTILHIIKKSIITNVYYDKHRININYLGCSMLVLYVFENVVSPGLKHFSTRF